MLVNTVDSVSGWIKTLSAEVLCGGSGSFYIVILEITLHLVFIGNGRCVNFIPASECDIQKVLKVKEFLKSKQYV